MMAFVNVMLSRLNPFVFADSLVYTTEKDHEYKELLPQSASLSRGESLTSLGVVFGNAIATRVFGLGRLGRYSSSKLPAIARCSFLLNTASS